MNTAAIETRNEGLSLAELQADPFGDSATQARFSDEDKALHVRFYMEPVEQTAKSKLEGRRIFEDTEYVEIMIPGDKQTIIRRQVFPMDRQRFPQHYARFKQGLADQTVGTPLTELTFIPAAKVKEYEFFGIKTIEQLASVSDGTKAAQSMMGFNTDRQKAVQFLEVAKGAAPVNELRARLDEREAELESLRTQFADLAAKVEEQGAKKTK